MEDKDASNQVLNLEKLISEVQQVEKEEYTEADFRIGSNREVKMDVLSLPPRSEIHQANKRTHIRLSKPLKRFIFVIILIVALIGGGIYFFGYELIDIFN